MFSFYYRHSCEHCVYIIAITSIYIYYIELHLPDGRGTGLGHSGQLLDENQRRKLATKPGQCKSESTNVKGHCFYLTFQIKT